MWRSTPPVLLVGLAALVGATGCASREAMGIGALSVLGPGVVNDPRNKSLRFDLLKFGLDQFCREMRQRGAPLKLRDGEPVAGRFFADECDSQIIDEEQRKTFVVRYAGRGYGWSNVTGRLGFASAGLVEYAPDFRLHDGAMYVYFRTVNVASASFQTLLVESALASMAVAVGGLAGITPERIGRDIVEGQLRRGFTVIRYGSTGETEFGMGFVPPGKKPWKPFRVESGDRVTLDVDRTEVHSNQQDLVGGFVVPESGMALTLTARVEGAPAVDVLLVSKPDGDRVVDRYVRTPGPSILPAPPLLDEVVPAGALWQRRLAVPRGTYYLMIDHSVALGRASPPVTQGDDRAARVDYVVELGER
jgi:hypothetical protein